MFESSNPSTVHPPLGTYAHVMKVPAGAESFVISGQVGVAPDGTSAEGIRAQCEQTFRNLLACLASQDLGAEHVVKLTAYITDARFVGAYREARNEVMGHDFSPTSTLLVVSALAAPELLVEVEAWAARPLSD